MFQVERACVGILAVQRKEVEDFTRPTGSGMYRTGLQLAAGVVEMGAPPFPVFLPAPGLAVLSTSIPPCTGAVRELWQLFL